jgi:hypothetical protein
VNNTDIAITVSVASIAGVLTAGIVIAMIRAEIQDRREHRRFMANLRRIQTVERRSSSEST